MTSLPDYTASNPAKIVPKKGIGKGGDEWALDENGNWIPTADRTRRIMEAFQQGGCHAALMSDVVFSYILKKIGVERMVGCLSDALGAKGYKAVKVKDADGGERVETFEFPDDATRLKAVEICFEQLTSEKRMLAFHVHQHNSKPRGEDGAGDLERIRNSPAAKRAMLRGLGLSEGLVEQAMRETPAQPETVDAEVVGAEDEEPGEENG